MNNANNEEAISKEEMLKYLTETGLYDDDEDFFYERRMIDTDRTIPISELVERFIDVDKYFSGGNGNYSTWNIKQILTNIDMIIPIEDRR